MIKTTISQFEGSKTVLQQQGVIINAIEYNKQKVNKIRIAALQKMQGNNDSKTGVEITYLCVNGIGTIDVHGSRVPFKVGDIVVLKSDDPYTIINDSLDNSIDLISIF